MPRKRVCCISNCQNLRKDAILYQTPSRVIGLQKWLKCLSGVCDIRQLKPGISVVCKNHFEARFITPQLRLICNAYPSLFSHEEIASGLPSDSSSYRRYSAIILVKSELFGVIKLSSVPHSSPLNIQDKCSLFCVCKAIYILFTTSRMFNHCSIPRCNSSRKDTKLHVFPCINKIRLKKWLDSINSESLWKLSVDELKKCYVCQKHFEKRFTTPKGHLLSIAYPSLFTHDEILSGRPSIDHNDIVHIPDHEYARKEKHWDHNYCKIQEVTSSGTHEIMTLPDENIKKHSTEISLGDILASSTKVNDPNVPKPLKKPSSKSSESLQYTYHAPKAPQEEVLDRRIEPKDKTNNVKVKSIEGMTKDLENNVCLSNDENIGDAYNELPPQNPYGTQPDEYEGTEMEMSMYDDDNDVQLIEKPLLQSTEQLADKTDLHEGIACNVCEKEIFGFRYVCVECGDWDLCQQCEAQAAHPQHYVLRVPHSRDEEEIQRVIEAVRLSVRQRTCYDLIPLQLEVTREEGGETFLEEWDEDNKEDIDLSAALQEDPPLTDQLADSEHQPVGDPLESNECYNQPSEFELEDPISSYMQPAAEIEEDILIYGNEYMQPSVVCHNDINEVLQSSASSQEEEEPSVYCELVTSQLAPSIECPQTTYMDNEVLQYLQSCECTQEEMFCERVTSPPTVPPFMDHNGTIWESTPDLEYMNITNIDNASFLLHQDKLFGLATVKLKRLPARCLQSRRRRTSAQYNETDAETTTDSDYEESDSDVEMQSDGSL